MVDSLSPETRSKMMGRVRSKDTGPEMIVRRTLHRLGYRYRLHHAGLPGKPDIVFARRRKVIFVHGCFWHRHDCPRASMPKSNTEFWTLKFKRNIVRDNAVLDALRALGWSVLVAWECETKDQDLLIKKFRGFLDHLG